MVALLSQKAELVFMFYSKVDALKCQILQFKCLSHFMHLHLQMQIKVILIHTYIYCSFTLELNVVNVSNMDYQLLH